jgi:CRP/FNR family transcriptional regulator, cyclic AMP receptor protein
VLSGTELDYLRQVSVFAALSDSVLEQIGQCARRQEIAAGAALFEEGEPAKEMVVVLSGKLEVYKRGRNRRLARIAVLGPGDVVGEMSLVDIQPRSAAVRALEPTAMAVLSHGDIGNVYREDPRSYTLLVLNIAREISIRLRRMDQMLANIATEIQEVTSTPLSRAGDDPDEPERAAE